MPPATAKLRSSSRPNSCKLPRSHSAPWFTALLRNSSHRASAADLEDELACAGAFANKRETRPREQEQQLPTLRRCEQAEHIPCHLGSAYLYLYPKRYAWACSVGAKASINAERSCATGSHLSPILALRPPATATLRSSTAPNSCKRPRSHSAPWFTALLRNSSDRRPCDARGNWSIIADSPFK